MNIDPFAPAADLATQLRAGAFSARALLESCLTRVSLHNPAINAVVTLDLDRARARADAIDARRGGAGSLLGLPATIKDSFETAGLRTTCGAPQYSKHLPDSNAEAVERLAQAGMVLFGKTNVPIYTADLQSYNLLFGATGNPWDPSRTCGGSSGGAAAAVAAGFSAFELGSDIGGSIRIPAHFCGVYGHKPSYGMVPMRGHIPPPPGSLAVPDLAVAGPIARSAGDLELLLEVLAGGGADSFPTPVLAEARARRLQDFRIAVWLEDSAFPVDEQVAGPLRRTVEALRKAGAKVDEAARPALDLAENFDDYLRLLWPVTTAHLTGKAFARVQEAGRRDAPDSMHAKLAHYSAASHREWLQVHERREQVRAKWQAFFRDFDVLLCPVGPVCAFAHDHSDDLMARTVTVNGRPRWYWEQLAWIALATLAGLPATVAPVGRSENGLPVGVQIIGPSREDRTGIAFARALADLIGGFQPPPEFV